MVIGVVGGMCTIVFSISRDWQLAIATIISVGGLILAASIVRFYTRQVYIRYNSWFEYQKKQLEFQLERGREQFQDTLQNTHVATEALHKFIHHTRDSAASFINDAQESLERLRKHRDFQQYTLEVLRARDNFLYKLLEEMIRVFVPLVPPGSQPWAAIREIHTNGDAAVYKTLLRAGPVSPDRYQTSEGIRQDEGIADYLRQQHRLGKDVVILGKDRSQEIWKVMANDALGEDKNTIAAPILLKSKSRKPYEMPMILYMNSPFEDVFNETHTPYMRCCADVFSILIGMITSVVLAVNPYQTTKT